MSAQLTHLQLQFGQTLDVGRSYGVGQSVHQIAKSQTEVSLSTLKAAIAGKHIRPAQYKAVERLLCPRPLDAIESRIRYVEAYLGEYLVTLTDHVISTDAGPHELDAFFALRRQRRSSPEVLQARLAQFIQAHCQPFRLTASDLGDAIGKSGKRDLHSVSRPTAIALMRGRHIRPPKFLLLCRRLDLGKSSSAIAKLLYAEAFLGGHLLGKDLTAFASLSAAKYPRTAAVLIYSTKHSEELA